VIRAPPAPKAERALAPHPTLKPQAFMRQVVRGVLPLGQGIILDPFMGSGSTLAAAAKLGLESIGLEVNADFFALAGSAIPLLAAL
jgi:site-specific DNA-methyltransferase (adenine-specific)